MKSFLLCVLITSGVNLSAQIDSTLFTNTTWEFRYIMNDSAYHAIPDSAKNLETVVPFKITAYPPAIYEFRGDSCVGYPTAMIDGNWTYKWKVRKDSLYFYEEGRILIAYKARIISPDKIELTGVLYDRISGAPETRIEFAERLRD